MMLSNGHPLAVRISSIVLLTMFILPVFPQGYAEAQYNLGLMYHKGQGVPQNYVQAHMWSNLAASQLTGSDRKRAVENRARIAEAQRLAREWKPKSSGDQ